MEVKLSRRGLFGFIGGAVAATALPTEASAPIKPFVISTNGSLGMFQPNPSMFVETFNYDTNSTFSEIVRKTLRENSHKVYDNVCMNNPLLKGIKNGRCTQVS